MRRLEATERLIERYKEIQRLASASAMTHEEAVDLIAICIALGKLGFWLPDEEHDWLLPFTSD